MQQVLAGEVGGRGGVGGGKRGGGVTGSGGAGSGVTGSGGGTGSGEPEALLAGVDVEEGGAVQGGPGVVSGQPVRIHAPVARTLNCTKDKILAKLKVLKS